jgi:hypothetical protein
MGLDMYLKLNRARSENIANVENVKDLESLFDKVIVTVKEEFTIGYWRKANAIFALIENTCKPEGIEDCERIYISVDQIKTMLDICKQVKENPDTAHENLPTQSGFFFGSTEYDEYYFDMIDYTIELFEKVLTFMSKDNNDNYYDVIFYAWW